MMLFGITAAAVLALDIITKLIVSSGMELGSSIAILPGIFEFTYIQNTGAAWGVLADKQILLQVLTAVLLIAVIVYAVIKRKALTKPELVSLALIAGGGLGNFFSRLVKGYVVDFMNIHIIPVFNVADIGITVGCLLLIITVFVSGKKKTDGE